MSKAKQIMALYDGKRTTREIAEIVGCGDSYVRTVARQRKGLGVSENDRRYRATELGRASRRRADVAKLAKRGRQYETANTAYFQVIMATANREAASCAGRKAYDAARLQGKSTSEAHRIRKQVYHRVLMDTADKQAARRAWRQAYRAAAPVLEAAE